MPRYLKRGMDASAIKAADAKVRETVEGIRALVIDKDHQPRWNPARVEDVTPDQVAAFFDSPWPAVVHPLRALD